MDDDKKREEKYAKMGVTPQELYLRQNGICYLKPEILPDGTVIVYCTDGTDKADAATMLNPTYECVRCMMGFVTRVIQDGTDGSGGRGGEPGD